MTTEEYRKAVDGFAPDGDLKGRLAARLQGKKRRGGAGRRTVAAVAAALAVLVCTMGAALAASPELRQSVLSFFHLEETERLPGPEDLVETADGGPAVSQNTISGQVQAQYIRWADGFEGWSRLVEGEDGMAFQFWEAADGELRQETVPAETCEFHVSWRGVDYQGTVSWCVRDGDITLDGGDWNRENETEWYVSQIPGGTDAALLYLSQGQQVDYVLYVLLLHLDTGETEDILAETGVENLDGAYDYVWTDDLSRALVTCRDGWETTTTWYCDLTARTLTPVGELTDTGADGALFADDDTLIVTEDTDTECSCWSYDLTTGQVKQVLAGVQRCKQYTEGAWGVMFFGGRYALSVDQSGGLTVVDLKTGAETMVEGFTLDGDGDFISSPSLAKLLYWREDKDADGLAIAELGALDLEKGTFLAFDREGYDTVYEYAVGWLDDDRAAVYARDQDGQGAYLCLYEF